MRLPSGFLDTWVLPLSRSQVNSVAVDQRPAVFIDVEGFGSLYGNESADSLWGLSDLMEGVIIIGRGAPEAGLARIFAHQFGDGFVITEDCNGGVGRMAAVAIALHQFVLIKSRHFCRSALEKGGLSDVMGCYPKAVTESGGSTVMLGEGLLTITPVIGTALIKTYKLLGDHRGSVAVVPAHYRNELEHGIVAIEENGVLYLNWIESVSDTLDRCRHILRIGRYNADALRVLFTKAAQRNDCPARWLERTEPYLRLRTRGI